MKIVMMTYLSNKFVLQEKCIPCFCNTEPMNHILVTLFVSIIEIFPKWVQLIGGREGPVDGQVRSSVLKGLDQLTVRGPIDWGVEIHPHRFSAISWALGDGFPTTSLPSAVY